MPSRRTLWLGAAALVFLALLVPPVAGAGTVAGADAAGRLGADSGAVGAPSAATSSCADAAGPAVVVALPGGERAGPNDTVSLYRGSELVVEGCHGVELDAADVDGLTVLAGSGDRLHLRIDGPVRFGAGTDDGPSSEDASELPTTDVDLGRLATGGDVDGPTLAVAGGVVDTALLDGPLAAPTDEDAATLAAAEAAVLEQERVLLERLEDLEARTEELESGSWPTPVEGDAGDLSPTGDVDAEAPGAADENRTALAADETAVREVRDAHRQYRKDVAALRRALLAVAASDVGTARTVAAIEALDDREATVDEATADGVASYDAAVADRDRTLTWALRLRVLGLGFAAVLLGVALGAALPVRRGRAARRQLREGEWATYSRRVVRAPVVVGVLLLSLGLGWLALRAGRVLLEVVA